MSLNNSYIQSLPIAHPAGGSAIKGDGSNSFIYDNLGIFAQNKFGGKSYSQGARWRVPKVGQSKIFFGVVFGKTPIADST